MARFNRHGLAAVRIARGRGRRPDVCSAVFLKNGEVPQAYTGLQLTNVTVSSNPVGVGVGSITRFNDGLGTLPVVSATNTLVADGANACLVMDNSSTPPPPLPALTSQGHNLDQGDSCGLTGTGDLSNVADPKLGPLQNNGGPTETIALLAGSPAIDAGDNAACPPADQRGSDFGRPKDGDGDGIVTCDIGAFELQAAYTNPQPTLSNINPISSAMGGSDLSLTVSGTGFVTTSVVRWNGTALATNFVSPTELHAAVPAANIAQPGTIEVTVYSPAPGGGLSTLRPFYAVAAGTATVGIGAVGVGTSPSPTGTAAASVGPFGAAGTTLTGTATGQGTLVTTMYTGDPELSPGPNASGVYFDVYVGTGSSFSTLSALVCNLNKGNLLYWWDGNGWALASAQSFDPTMGCVTLAVSTATAPTVVQLTGTPFGVSADTTPPTTAASSAPGPVPAGQPLLSVSASATVQTTTGTTLGKINLIQCWNSQAVAVTLAANDTGAGVRSITYTATGARLIASTTVPGATIVVPTISAAGLTTLRYGAVDKLRNQEVPRSLSVLVGPVDNGKTIFACSGPTPTFALPTHGTLVLTGTVTVNRVSSPFSKTFRF